MGQVCSVLREKLCGPTQSSSESSTVLLDGDVPANQNYLKLNNNVEDQNDNLEVVIRGDAPQVTQLLDNVPAVEVVPEVVIQNTNACPPKSVESLLNITNISVLPAEDQSISEYVTARPPLKSFRERSNSISSDQSAKKVKVDDYLDFPVFKDVPTKQFMTKSKVMVVLRGLSGSGKSHISSQLLNLYGDKAVECSADHYFVQPDGQYVFDGTLLKDAHGYCFELAKTEMTSGRPLVIINNTNVKFWEYKRYLSLSKEHHYSVLIMEPHTPWAWDPVLLAQRTQHGMEESFLRDKLSQYQPAKPVYYAWFLNTADSSLLVQRSWACLRAVAELPQCRRSLAYYCNKTAPHHMQGGVSELVSYYSLCGSNGSFQPLHCTAMFSNRGKAAGTQQYEQRVTAHMGRVYTVLVTGLVITPRTIGVRALLPDEALHLWQKDDDEDRPPNVEELFSLVQGDGAAQAGLGEEAGLEEEEEEEEGVLDTEKLTVQVPDLDHNMTTTKPVPFERVQQLCGDEGPSLHRLRPFRRGVGRRAHFTVAVGPSVQAVTTGFDMMHLTHLEHHDTGHDTMTATPGEGGTKTSGGSGQEPMEVDHDQGRRQKVLHTVQGGTLADYGEGIFAFYPDQCFEVTALFSASY